MLLSTHSGGELDGAASVDRKRSELPEDQALALLADVAQIVSLWVWRRPSTSWRRILGKITSNQQLIAEKVREVEMDDGSR